MNQKHTGWWWARVSVCALVIVYMVVPLLIVVAISFSSAPFLTFPPPGLSLQWYRAMRNPAWTESLMTSVMVMIPTAMLATTVGLGAALGLNRSRHWASGLVRGLLMSPLVVPVIITGAALYMVLRPLGLYGTITGLVVAHTVLCIPYALATTSSSLQVLDAQLGQAAASLGATPWVTFRRITLPLVRAGLLSSFLFSLVVSFDELVVSLFVSSPQARTVTVQMWSNIRGDVDPTIAALATLLFLFALSILVVEAVVGRGEATR